MTTSIIDAKKLTYREVAEICGGVHVSTIWRWTTRGVNGTKLRSTPIGGRRFILRDDLEEFLAAGRDQDGESQADISERSEAADKELDLLGI